MSGALALILLVAAAVIALVAVRMLRQSSGTARPQSRSRSRKRSRWRSWWRSRSRPRPLAQWRPESQSPSGSRPTGAGRQLFRDLVDQDDRTQDIAQRWEQHPHDSHETADLVKDYKRMAAAGDLRAIHELATLYKIGQHVKQNQHKAAQLYAKGADLGDSACMRGLAAMYEAGQGVKRDKITAYLLYDMAHSHARGPDTRAVCQVIEEHMKALRAEMSTMERAIADKHIKEQREAE